MHGTKITSGLTRRHRTYSNASSRSSAATSTSDVEDDENHIEPDQGNVLTHIISQLRPGADLSRVVLPTFILEPRSMLERITNFMCHPEMLLSIPQIEDPIDRFVAVVKFYLSGWHIRPPGVKKPLNPILGEVFSCYWDLPDGTRAYYISEQTSHHPPKSSYFYMAPGHDIRIDGTLKPRGRFLGNSAASLMEGVAVLSLLNRGEDKSKGERYWLTQPNMYARGILFGNMKYELGDHSVVRCPELGLTADIDFKTKGWVSGTYDAILGTIKDERTNQVLFEISGLWSEEMFIKDLRNGKKQMFFDARKAKPSRPQVRPLEEHHEYESMRLWRKTARAVRKKNHELATDEKTKIEEQQREEAAKRAAAGVEWHPKLFRLVHPEVDGESEDVEKLEWIINATIDGATSAKQTEQILAIYPILPGQVINERAIPPYDASATHSNTAGNASSNNNQGDLIECGEGNSTTTPAAKDEKRSSSGPGGNADLLDTQGQNPDGPLLGFTEDLKRDLPSEKAKMTTPTPSRTRRAGTNDSDDAFFDAEE
ncbi:Oxysterol-binding protein [Xylaria sp. CBS 124048]|nr:Oxysterol-binding protein [Xylaria sp. CBS 124048]